MHQANNWTIILSRNKAKIFSSSMSLIEEIKNPLGRERNRTMQRDSAGMNYSNTRGIGPHRLTGGKNPHEEAAVSFAHSICNMLQRRCYKDDFKGLVIAAEPHLMGILKKKMTPKLKAHVLKWVNKDLEKISVKDLPAHLNLY